MLGYDDFDSRLPQVQTHIPQLTFQVPDRSAGADVFKHE